MRATSLSEASGQLFSHRWGGGGGGVVCGTLHPKTLQLPRRANMDKLIPVDENVPGCAGARLGPFIAGNLFCLVGFFAYFLTARGCSAPFFGFRLLLINLFC